MSTQHPSPNEVWELVVPAHPSTQTQRDGQRACDRRQVSPPLTLGRASGQTPWLLSLQGELVAFLEDASQMGLHTDINKRQDLLQRHGAAPPRSS
ncbi:hypothetical protein mRhiFer1_001778 [Rhinolophus ferrumequinum]|uniref:Uncharacterized protein n=1 Tax=Rhinolophus ferrumequinum TaxID=59479 RepID=A0A7J7X3B4_RHIFE|nr:hypothetical protein mRhiFer1_001778 [Rhinolophus ferrumequinum]